MDQQPSGSRKRSVPPEFDQRDPAKLPIERQKLEEYATDSENSQDDMVPKTKNLKLDDDDGAYHENIAEMQSLQEERNLLEERRIQIEEQRIRIAEEIAAIDKKIAKQQRKIDGENRRIPDLSETTSDDSPMTDEIADENVLGDVDEAAEDIGDDEV